MEYKVSDIIKEFKSVSRKRERLEQIKDRLIELDAIMFSAKTMTIMQECDMGGSPDSYRTPMLNEIDELDNLEKEQMKLLKDISTLYSLANRCSENVKQAIYSVYIYKSMYMNAYCTKVGYSQVHMNRLINKDLQKIIDSVWQALINRLLC